MGARGADPLATLRVVLLARLLAYGVAPLDALSRTGAPSEALDVARALLGESVPDDAAAEAERIVERWAWTT